MSVQIRPGVDALPTAEVHSPQKLSDDYPLRFAPRSYRKWTPLAVAGSALGGMAYLADFSIGAGIGVSHGTTNAVGGILIAAVLIFLSSLPLTTTPGTPKRGEAVRVNDRFQIDDPQFARLLWEQTPLKQLVHEYGQPSVWRGEVLGLNPNIRVYRYKPG